MAAVRYYIWLRGCSGDYPPVQSGLSLGGDITDDCRAVPCDVFDINAQAGTQSPPACHAIRGRRVWLGCVVALGGFGLATRGMADSRGDGVCRMRRVVRA